MSVLNPLSETRANAFNRVLRNSKPHAEMYRTGHFKPSFFPVMVYVYRS